MTHTPLHAIDELANLRGTIAALRLRESELCDEIRTGATEHGTLRLEGKKRIAVIEIRKTYQLDVSQVPDEILNDPNLFIASHKTHVLLWPKTNTTNGTAAQDTSLDSTPNTEHVEQDLSHCDITAQETVEPDVAETLAVLEMDAEPDITEGFAPASQANVPEPTLDVQNTNLSEESFSELNEPENVVVTEPDIEAPSDPDIATQVAPNDTVFDIVDANTPMPTIDMPTLDTQQIAETAEEIGSPPDLRATAYTDLQPMGDLTEEDVEAALYAADIAMEPAMDTEAVLDTEILQAQLDTQIETGDTTQDAAAFATRRVIGAPG
ncbi:hypothetical protein [Pacificibacter marinus]|uniref:Uncharacterized protein n=1 Tax=Pacificibacter marinus TaxID=658057 RepID=A0A1Y5SS49_9RHOB|nr:hypothetical protein [Pacificibacter marinus]SEK72043.1 hypothetical protein SAMN04488032_105218 [Pacificibacter marinus]SLN43999.1 hypothetical protein PAM7971_02108 [Pacificibacter marinus]